MARSKSNYVRLNITITPEQYEYIYNRAKQVGLSISDLIKILIVEDWRVTRVIREKYISELVGDKIKNLSNEQINSLIEKVEEDVLEKKNKIIEDRHKRGLMRNNPNSKIMEEKLRLSKSRVLDNICNDTKLNEDISIEKLSNAVFYDSNNKDDEKI